MRTLKPTAFCLLFFALPGALEAQSPASPAAPIRTLQEPHAPRMVSPRRGPVYLEKEQVTVEIHEALAKTTVRQTFRNSGRGQAEHIYLFPLPADATIGDFQLTMNGQPVAGEVLDKDKARQIYEGIVRKARDPGLLELMGTGLVRARIFPVPPGGTSDVILSYSSPLDAIAGTRAYTYPLRRRALCGRPIQSFALSAEIHAKGGLKAVFSPTHPIDVARQGDNDAKISFEMGQAIPDRDFDLFFSQQSGLVGMTALTHKKKDRDGAFSLFLTPAFDPAVAALPKDVVFVFDTSGSMAGPKMEQAREAMRRCIENLGKDDRFAVIPFSTEARPHTATLVANSAEQKASALSYVGELQARGGTNIEEALTSALAMRAEGDKRPFQVLFLTDGLPTIGFTDADQILKRVQQNNSIGTRIFVFGVGDDVNTRLLDTLAEETRAAREYVRPNEDLELKVTALFDKVSAPVVTQLKLHFDGLATYDVYPKELPDLFRGSQLMVVGRYKDGGHRAVRLSGQVGEKSKEWVFEADFATEEARFGELENLWASRKVAFLLDQIRLNGSNQELIAEVTRLGKTYGLVTPYTSFLVVEEGQRLAQARGIPATRFGSTFTATESDEFWLGLANHRLTFDHEVAEGEASRKRLERLADAQTGEKAVDESLALRSLKSASSIGGATNPAGPATPSSPRGSAPAGPGGAWGGGGRPSPAKKNAGSYDNPFVRRVDERVFHLIGGVWTDSTFKKKDKAKVQKVVFLSDAYFELMKSDKKIAKIFALGTRVLFKKGETFVEIVAE